MRVLFSSTWGYGHTFPMVPLARAFAAAGHAVLWATSGDAGPRIAAAGLDAIPAGLSGQPLGELRERIRLESAGVRPGDRAAFVYPRLFGQGLTAPMVADLLQVARGWAPDLLIHEHGELAAPLVGALLGVPSVTHSFGGAIPPEILQDASDLVAPVWSRHGLVIPPYAGCFSSTYLDICPAAVQSVPLDHIPVIQPLRPVPYAGEPGAAQPGPGLPGPGLPGPGQPGSRQLGGARPAYLADDDRELVYLTLGTVMNQATVLRATVEGLAGLGVRILVTVGPDGDPSALGPQPSHVSVERYIPQTDVLPHCAAVVSHGGSGTFLAALGHGLPQLCLPQAADQFRNAQGAVRSGAGLALDPDEANPDAVAAATRRILVEDGFGAAATAVAHDIAAMPSPAQVVTALEGLT